MKYPLQELVYIKQKKLDEAEKVLKEKKELLTKEEQKLKELEEARNKVKEHREDKLTQLRAELDTGTTSPKIQQMKSYLKVVEEELRQKQVKVVEQQKAVDAATKAVEIARQDLIKKQQDVEKLKTHKKEWEKQQLAEIEQKESLESDEIGSVLHQIKRKSKHPQKKEE